MQPILNSSSFNPSTDDDVTTVAVQETAQYPSSYQHPSTSIYCRQTSTPTAVNRQSDFPRKLSEQIFSNISDNALKNSVALSWQDGSAGKNWFKIAQKIYGEKNTAQLQNKKSLFDILNNLKDIGSTKKLYDAFQSLNFMHEASQLLDAANIQFDLDKQRNMKNQMSTRTTTVPINRTRNTPISSIHKPTPLENNPNFIYDILINKQLPNLTSDIYEEITSNLSITRIFGGDWRSLAETYGMNVGDCKIIESKAKYQNKLPSEILLDDIRKNQVDKSRILLDLYNNLNKKGCIELAKKLLIWAWNMEQS